MLSLLAEALAGSPGPRLLDVGGGTGNYAVALAGLGFEPLVLDRSPAMLERAAAKGLETIEGDARELPFRERSFDAVTMLSMLHHVDEPAAAIAEAKRVLAEGGRLALTGYYREDIADLWLLDYFPSSRP
ncbi:MAG: class I SAM-dependent methyltransferase, partial [Solirubrobacterales bacterium]